MSAVRATLAAAILFGIVAVFVPSAHAFERSTVDGDPTKPLFWRYRWVIVRPAYDTCAEVPGQNVRAAIGRSIATWNAAAEGMNCSDFRLFDEGEPTGTRTNLDGGDPDYENRILWRDEGWPEDVSADTLALTTIVYRSASGQIVDADIDLNGAFYWTDTDTAGAIDRDVENTMTHELGHLLGLAHVDDVAATMHGMSPRGDTEKRTLEADDIAGLCFIYPFDQPTPEAPIFPVTPLQGGCSAAHGRGGAIWLAIVAIAVALRRIRWR